MNIQNKLSSYEKKFPLGILGLIVSIIFGLSGIYYSVFYQKKPQLDIEMVSNFNVLDVKESIGNLDIIYENKSLSEKKQSLSVINLKVINNGNSDITIGSYDPKFPAGLSVVNGILAEKTLLTSSHTSYELSTLSLEQIDNKKIFLPQIIINSNEYYELKLIVLHSNNIKPTIEPFGVIAGNGNIRLINSPLLGNEKNIIERFFDGSILLNLSRFAIYGFIFLTISIFTLAIWITVSEKLEAIKKQKLIEQFKESQPKKTSKLNSAFFKEFNALGKHEYSMVYSEITSPNIDKKLSFYYETILLEMEILSKDSNNYLIINHANINYLIELLEFLESKGEISLKNKFELPLVHEDDVIFDVDELEIYKTEVNSQEKEEE